MMVVWCFQLLGEILLCLTVWMIMFFLVGGGFLIAHSNKGLCLSTHRDVVILKTCNVTNPSQHWSWTSTMRLKHTLMSRCLWVDQSTSVPRHTRLVKLRDCHTAPAWRCYDSQGIFGLAETPMFLKKQGVRVVVRSEQRYSNWSMITMDSHGRTEMTSLCPDKGQTSPFHQKVYGWFWARHQHLSTSEAQFHRQCLRLVPDLNECLSCVNCK